MRGTRTQGCVMSKAEHPEIISDSRHAARDSQVFFDVHPSVLLAFPLCYFLNLSKWVILYLYICMGGGAAPNSGELILRFLAAGIIIIMWGLSALSGGGSQYIYVIRYVRPLA